MEGTSMDTVIFISSPLQRILIQRLRGAQRNSALAAAETRRNVLRRCAGSRERARMRPPPGGPNPFGLVAPAESALTRAHVRQRFLRRHGRLPPSRGAPVE